MIRSLPKAASCLGARGEWVAAHDLFGTSGFLSDLKVYRYVISYGESIAHGFSGVDAVCSSQDTICYAGDVWTQVHPKRPCQLAGQLRAGIICK